MSRPYSPRHELRLSGRGLRQLLEAVLEKRRSFRFRATGFSMSPFIKDGDVLTLSPLARGKPRLGDIVAFPNATTNGLVVHRVVEIEGDCAMTKGDNADWPDGRVPLGDVLARVTLVERGGRNVRRGLGAERLFIASLSRKGWLRPLLVPVTKAVRTVVPRPPQA
jgi:signal peptidase I